MRFKKSQIVFIVGTCLLFAAESAFAAGYTTREIIPGEAAGTNDFMSYLNSLYSFGIGISGVLAVFMIGFGAFKYIVFSAGNASTMGDAKDTIYSAIFGLGLVLVAWLILYVINPDLINSTLTTVPTIKDCLDKATCN
ncbi:hypothetical protein HN784_01210 [bacterium]|jgi:formate/nitrite transporter FocA (FNT family)|nr:hypothetical protein [bacterium]MBT4251082.1 hypothetical protein [bacterium]MBT4597924.1 hypothetical protein [bacterium]MBT6753885.1 hypothetical protein [bacterium]MBT7037314.1 hypothetical protein [bacterium]